MTTAAITSSSKPWLPAGWPEARREETMTPVMAAVNPAKAYTKMRTARTRTPLRRAAVALPPTA